MAAKLDIWGRALEIEKDYGDRAEAVVGATLAALPPSAIDEIRIWAEIGETLRELHCIGCPGSRPYSARMAKTDDRHGPVPATAIEPEATKRS